MRILGVIPARHASTRLPGKPLVDIGGMSMVQRVVAHARRCKALQHIVVATDDQRIVDHVRAFGADAILTSADHPSGTDRCHEALTLLGRGNYDAVVNIQGDEPFIVPGQIDELCDTLRKAAGGIATLAQVVADDRDLDNAGEVLITVDTAMDALYFSRAAIPFLRDASTLPRHQRFRFLKHVGLYGYTTDTLERIVQLAPSSLELAEGLEQLRWLEHGLKVRVGLTDHPTFSVDTPADLEEARRRAAAMPHEGRME